MTVKNRPKLHILGAKGLIGQNLLQRAKRDYQVIGYSSKTKYQEKSDEGICIYPISDCLKLIKPREPVIFLLYSKEKSDRAVIKRLLGEMAKLEPHLIFISSLSVWSRYQSSYALHKMEMEKQVKMFRDFSIIRLGFVHGRNLDGLSKILRFFAQRNFIALPFLKSKTGFITLRATSNFLISAAGRHPTRDVENVFQAFLTLHRAISLFGFKGKFVSIPFPKVGFILHILQFLMRITPSLLQSLLSVVFMPDLKRPVLELNAHLRRFIINDYAILFGKADLWLLRKHIAQIQNRNSVESYLSFTNSERFIFLYRLKELVQVEVEQKNPNGT